LRAEAKEEADADGSLLDHLESSCHGKFRKYRLQIHQSQQISIAHSSKKLPLQRTTMEAQVIDGLGSRDAKHSEPPAYKGQLLRILLRVEGDFVGACSGGAGRRIGWWWRKRVMVFVSRAVVPRVERRVMPVVREKHGARVPCSRFMIHEELRRE
jgi:hypothetical protein